MGTVAVDAMAARYDRRSKAIPPESRTGRGEQPNANNMSDTPVKTENDADARKLFLSIDYGTKTLSVAYRVLEAGEVPSQLNVESLHFFRKEYSAPQKAGWAPDGTFYWGYGLEQAIKAGKFAQTDTIELWKLLLYRDHQTSPIAERIQAQLDAGGADRTLETLISTHLREVVHYARQEISSILGRRSESILNLLVQVFLSVPQMWKAPANNIMTQAAKTAGIPYVELVYEPENAAAFYTYHVREELPKQFLAGDILLVADIGGGTGDFVSYEIRQDSDNGASVGLTLISTEGALCGSEFVNQQFLAWLKNKCVNFEAKCKRLGLSAIECLTTASDQFEVLKQRFSLPDTELKWIYIRGRQGAKDSVWEVDISTYDMEGFFRPVIADIVRCIDAQRSPRTRALLVPGGFGRSLYLIDYLTARYPSLKVMSQLSVGATVNEPVSRGALLRYAVIEGRGVPSRQSFGLAQVEVYDPDIHTDATYVDGDKMSNKRIRRGKPVPNYNIVERDPYDGELIVYERWVPILDQSKDRAPGRQLVRDTWQHFMVPIEQQVLEVQVFWTERTIMEHESIRKGANALSELKDGIEAWGLPLEKQLPDLAQLGFKAIQSEEKGMVFEIFYCLRVESNGANITTTCHLALPGTEPYDDKGEHRSVQAKLTGSEVYELCDASYNPFPRTVPV